MKIGASAVSGVTDATIYRTACLTLCWPRQCADFEDDDEISRGLNQWWLDNRDALPWLYRDDELFWR
jgi:hypothetical protein